MREGFGREEGQKRREGGREETLENGREGGRNERESEEGVGRDGGREETSGEREEGKGGRGRGSTTPCPRRRSRRARRLLACGLQAKRQLRAGNRGRGGKADFCHNFEGRGERKGGNEGGREGENGETRERGRR
jgi:hypothetical protein